MHHKKKTIVYFSTLVLILLMISSCNTDDTVDAINISNSTSLADAITNRATENGAVIACAASAADDANVVLVYFYLEAGATNVKFFETNRLDVDQNDYANYNVLDLTATALFEGTIYQFTRPFASEQWVIVTYELEGEIKISNPIRTKNISKPSVWNDAVTIDQQEVAMPKFTWADNAFGDNAIYFQVVSTIDNGFLSGTYTNENQFQYYNTSNVILNVTTTTPPNLTAGLPYKFTLMDVSEDNWVNAVVQKTFVVE